MLLRAMLDEPAFKGGRTLGADVNLGRLLSSHHLVRIADPSLDFPRTGGRLSGQILFNQQTLVVFTPRIGPIAVHIGQSDT